MSLDPDFLSEESLLVLFNEDVDVVVVLDVHLDVVEQVPVAHGLVIDSTQGWNRGLSLHKLGEVVVLDVSESS